MCGKRRETPPHLADFAQCHHGLNWPPRQRISTVHTEHGFSDVVAWEHHVRLPLRSWNRKSRTPRGKKHSTINNNSRQQWHNFRHHDEMHPWQGRMPSPPATRLPTPSQDPSRHALYLFCIVKARAVHIIHCTWSQNYQQFCFDYTQSFGRPHQPLLAAPSSRK